MDDIELDNLDKPEEEPEEQQEQETNIDDDDWRDQSIVIIDASNPDADIRGNLDAMREANRDLGKGLGVIRRAYTEDKKSLLREMGVNINKGDGPSAKAVFERLKVTVNRKGRVNGAGYDGTRIIVQKGKRLVYTENVKNASKVNEFKELVKRAEAEHEKTAVALVEEKLDVPVNSELANSVLRGSVERLMEEIDEIADGIIIEFPRTSSESSEEY